MAKTLKLSDIPVRNFGRFMIDRMKEFGDSIALIDGLTDKRYTYRDVIYRTERLAAGLQDIGVSEGEVVGVVSHNNIDYVTVIYATALITSVVQPVNPLYTQERLAAGLQDIGVSEGEVVGVVSHNNIDYVTVIYATALITSVVQPVNPLYTQADLNGTFRECKTKVVIVEQQFLSKVKYAVKDIPHIKIVVFSDSEADGCIAFDSLLNRSYGDYRTPPCDPKTTTMGLMSSSGTTGFPKAVQIQHYAIIANSYQLQGADLFRRDDCCILYLPQFHVYGLYVMSVTANFAGCKMVVIPKFEIGTYFRLIEKFKPNYLHNVPPVMVMLAKYPRIAEYDLSSVNRIMCGAAPLSEEIEHVIKKRFNLDHITQGFGMTETGVIHLTTDTAFRHKSVGKPLPLTEVKSVDPDTGKELGINREGELWMRGPQVGLGYLNLPTETRQMFLSDGWTRTGDIGYRDEDGFYFIVDRIKELIKYKGYQVAPATLEDILLRHDAVGDVGVIGVADEEAGELPRAYIVPKAGKQTNASELQQFVAGLVAPHMKLRGGVEFVTEIPRSASGKILRRVLRNRSRVQKSKY